MTTKVVKNKMTKKNVKSRKSRKSYKKRTGGSMLAAAAVPFGILGLQRLLKSSKTKKSMKKH